MPIISNIGGGGLSAPTSTFLATGSNAVPAGKIWKISSYTDDLTVDGDLVATGLLSFSVNGGNPHIDVGFGSFSQDFAIPRAGRLTNAWVQGVNGFGGLNTVSISLYNASSVFIQTLVSCQVTANAPGGSCSSSGTFNLDVFPGYFIRATTAYTPATAPGGNTRLDFTTDYAATGGGLGTITVASGQVINGSNYFVEEY